MTTVEEREKSATEHGHPVYQTCEKCGEYAMDGGWKPLGGSTSFAELKAYREASKVDSAYFVATLDYQDLSNNILNDSELTAPEKASKLKELVNEFENVVTNIETYYPEYKERKPTFMDKVKGFFGFSQVEDDSAIEFTGDSGFKMYKTKDGYRWLAYSSNAFQDLEKELFTTAALTEAVEWADQTGQRGPLRVFHVPDADIGDADFQAMAGRFLVESGTFRNDELGQKAIAYFLANKDKEFQVSIGFSYKLGDEVDGVYDWLRINERSVLPAGDAANPFTSFAFGEIGGKQLDERKVRMLNEMFGATKASEIVTQAEAKSKELETVVRFKSNDTLIEDLKALTEVLDDESKAMVSALVEKHEKAKKKEDDEEEDKKPPFMKKEADASDTTEVKEVQTSDVKESALEPITAALTEIREQLGGMGDLRAAVEALQLEVKGMKEKDAAAPKSKDVFRASEQNTNLLNPDKIKELVGDTEADTPVNPAAAYVQDIMPGLFAAQSQ